MIHVTFNLLFKFPKEGLQLSIDHDFSIFSDTNLCLIKVESSFTFRETTNIFNKILSVL